MTFGCLDCLEAQFSHKCGISAGRVHINASLVKFNVERVRVLWAHLYKSAPPKAMTLVV